jgi:drug/metabolite transporter (DMT)-like permease
MPAAVAVAGPSRGIVLILLAHIAFTTMDTTNKWLAASYPVGQIVWAFYLGFAVAALGRAAAHGGTGGSGIGGGIRAALATRHRTLQVLRAALLAVNMGCVVLALGLLPMAEVMAVGISYPLMITVLSALVLKEHVGPRRWAAVLVGFAGVLLILRPGAAVFNPASLLILAAAALFAVYQILTKILGRTDRPVTLTLYTALVGLVLTSAVAPFDLRMPDPAGLALLALSAAAGTIGHSLVIQALESTPASVLQPFNFVQLVWATLAGFLVFGEVPDTVTMAGASVVVASGLYVWWRERVRAGTVG